MFSRRGILVEEVFDKVVRNYNYQVKVGLAIREKLTAEAILTPIGAGERRVKSRGMLNREIRRKLG